MHTDVLQFPPDCLAAELLGRLRGIATYIITLAEPSRTWPRQQATIRKGWVDGLRFCFRGARRTQAQTDCEDCRMHAASLQAPSWESPDSPALPERDAADGGAFNRCTYKPRPSRWWDRKGPP
jgi:hypothetical protein